MLRLSRMPGQGLYIGRHVRVTVADYYRNGAELTVECPGNIAVSGPEVSGAEHQMRVFHHETTNKPGEGEPISVPLKAGELVSIGRGIVVTVISAEDEGEVQLGIDAPRHLAVSRDDFTLSDHLKFQDARDMKYGGRTA